MEKILIQTTTDKSLDNAIDVFYDVNHAKKLFPSILPTDGRALFNIKGDPTYLIVSTEEIEQNGTITLKRDVLARINGQASFQQLRSLYLKALNGQLSPSTELILDGDSGGFADNDGLFNGPGLFGLNLPGWLWLIPAAVGGYKGMVSKSKSSPAWLALGAYSFNQYLNNKK